MIAMDKNEAIAAVEQRAWAARKTISEVCAEASVLPAVWSRAKGRKAVSVEILRRMETALDRIESEKSA